MVFLLGAAACSTDADSDPDYWNTAGSGGDAGASGSGGATGGALCAPCTDSDQCGGPGDRCLSNSQTAEQFCGQDCASGGCPSGFDCVQVSDSVMQCAPSSGTCSGTAGSGGGTAGTGGGTAGTGGGTAGTGGGTSGTGGGTSGGTCSVELPGATGSEPGGVIPVCCAPTAAEKANIDGVFALLNEHRANNGIAPLAYDDKLEAAIQGHCIHMVEHSFFDHSAPESSVSSPWTRAETCGTSAGGENIAAGQNSPADVMSSWIKSPGHNGNMLDPEFTRVGIGYHGSYWGQIFGR